MEVIIEIVCKRTEKKGERGKKKGGKKRENKQFQHTYIQHHDRRSAS